jgi:O-antigen/teichoic acid export membrane protein
MLKGARVGRNVVLNWLALAITIGVAFFLSPFIVHRLGNVAYGLWTLVNSMIAYMSLLDLGLRGAVTRYVSKHHARGEHLEASRALSAAFYFRLGIGALIVLTSLVLSRVAISLFHVPPEMQADMRWAIGVTGISFAITLTMGVFGGVLVALQRFDLVSGVTIVQAVLRASGILWLLNSGYGIVGLAAWELTVVVIANTGLTTLAFRAYRELRVLFERPDSTTLRHLWGYSFWALLFNVCAQVIYYTDNLVVGVFISAGAVTFFTIAGGLLEYARQVVGALGTIVFPLASSLDAQGRHGELRGLLIKGTRATLLIALPIQAALFFRGQTFISLWVGQEYAAASGRVLQILLVAHVFAIANYTSYNIVGGLAKHKPVALIATLEAASNLVLSIVLARRMGLEGVAWGTVIPSLALQLFFWPRYICRTLDMPIREYIWQGWIRAGLAVAPFGFACYLANRVWASTGMLNFFGQMLLLLPVFVIGTVVCFSKELSSYFRSQPEWVVRRWDAALQFVKKAQ